MSKKSSAQQVGLRLTDAQQVLTSSLPRDLHLSTEFEMETTQLYYNESRVGTTLGNLFYYVTIWDVFLAD